MKDEITGKYIKIAIGINLLFIGLFFFLIKDYRPYILGILFGGSISILMFKILFFSTTKMLEKGPSGGRKYAFLQYMFRLLIFGIVLTIAAIADYLSLVATFLGLLSIKFSIQGHNIWTLMKERR